MKKEGKLHNSITSKNIYIGFLKQHFWTWILGPLDPHWGLDWVRHYRSWVVQCSPPLLPEGWGRCQTEGQRRPQPDPRGARQFRVNKPSAFSERLWEEKYADKTDVGELEKRRDRCDEAFVKTRLKYRNSFRGSAQFSGRSLCAAAFSKRSRINPFQAPPPISSFRCQGEGLESLRTKPALADRDFLCHGRGRLQFKV